MEEHCDPKEGNDLALFLLFASTRTALMKARLETTAGRMLRPVVKILLEWSRKGCLLPGHL